MAESRNIFSKGLVDLTNKQVVQKVKYNREHLLSSETAEELNTYLNFGIFPTFADTFEPKYDKNDNYKLIDSDVGTPGVRSLFNRAGAVMLGINDKVDYKVDISKGDNTNTNFWRIANNVPLMDSPKARQRIRQSSGCSIKELVNDSSNGLMGQETYAYSDFMYCKHLGKVPNNYMVTLRRFPLPVDDYIGAFGESVEQRSARVANNAACIGCMVTWMGVSGNELNNILKYNYNMPFKFEEAEWQQKNTDADSNTGMLNSMVSVFDSSYRAQYQNGTASTAGNAFFSHIGINGLGDAPYKNHAGFRDEKTKVWGPIDSVRSTYVRADKGLNFDQKITLVFEYELKSYNGINGKQAMLDLISNILNVTYTTGSFWGGGIKGFGAHQSNIFANLNIFKARGGFTNFIDAFALDLHNFSSEIKSWSTGDPGQDLKNLLNEVGGMLMSGILNKLGRPQKGMYNALLSPAPIGFWHLTIGNPKRPIMSLGNMIITNTTIEHCGPLGIDDFPTGLKVTVELDRGKPRDLRDIERIYMQGNDRIYSSMSDKVFDMYKNSELYKSHKRAGTLAQYNPVTSTAEYKEATYDDKNNITSKPTITVADYASIKTVMKKYFGTDDEYSIYIPAVEQEYGSGKNKKTKPSTAANSNLKGGN